MIGVEGGRGGRGGGGSIESVVTLVVVILFVRTMLEVGRGRGIVGGVSCLQHTYTCNNSVA